MAPRIRINEGNDTQPLLLWDSIWNTAGGFADWAIASVAELLNLGGLQATAALESAVIIQLFTDRRLPANHPLRRYVDGDDLRGWWGDGIDVRSDLGESEMGSLLWVLARAPLNEEIRRWAETLASDALQTLVTQKVVARIDVAASIIPQLNQLDLAIKLYRADGSLAVDRRFDDIWGQLNGSELSAAIPSALGLDFSDPDNSQYLPGLV
jgi:phage gp46-like protein